MEQLRQAIQQMIDATEAEMEGFLSRCYTKSFKKKSYLSEPRQIVNEVFFVTKGIIRIIIVDRSGVEHTTHFALEHQFISDYTSYLQNTPAAYYLQALEEVEVIVMPRAAIEWGYEHMKDGQKMGRLIAEFYFTYNDTRIQHRYSKTPKERYDMINQVFPNIHNRAPQHMIASYIGITSVHLSRLKKADRLKT